MLTAHYSKIPVCRAATPVGFSGWPLLYRVIEREYEPVFSPLSSLRVSAAAAPDDYERKEESSDSTFAILRRAGE